MRKAAIEETPATPPAKVVEPPVEGLVRRPELLKIIGIHDVTRWRLQQAGKFPQPVHLGRAVAWRRSEIAEWLKNLK